MSFGLEVYGDTGGKTFEVNSNTMLITHSEIISGGYGKKTWDFSRYGNKVIVGNGTTSARMKVTVSGASVTVDLQASRNYSIHIMVSL